MPSCVDQPYRPGNGGRPAGTSPVYARRVVGGPIQLHSEIASNQVDEANASTVYQNTNGPVAITAAGSRKYVFKKITRGLSFSNFLVADYRMAFATVAVTTPNTSAAILLSMYTINSDWDPTTLCWNNMPALASSIAFYSVPSSTTITTSTLKTGGHLVGSGVYGFAFVCSTTPSGVDASFDSVTSLSFY